MMILNLLEENHPEQLREENLLIKIFERQKEYSEMEENLEKEMSEAEAMMLTREQLIADIA